MRVLPLIFLVLTTLLQGQNKARVNRQSYSSDTRTILHKLDSLNNIDRANKREPALEFRTVYESGRRSDKFILYGQLTQHADEAELLNLLADKNEDVVVRGYAYMAYAYRCDKQKKKENPLSYTFRLRVLNGCLESSYTFGEFKKEIRVRNKYDPKNQEIPDEEKKVITGENMIRDEQGVVKRKK